MSPGVHITVVGIGADGWAGLAAGAREAILSAEEVFGSERQLELLPEQVKRRHAWPSPMAPAVDALVARAAGHVCVVATGDPMLHGIGATLAARLPPGQLEVLPHVSAFSLACARLLWPAAEVDLISTVARPMEVVARTLQPGRRLAVYLTGRDGARRLAKLLAEHGYGPSRLVVLERLGAPDEEISDTTAERWGERDADPLHMAAVECRAAPGAGLLTSLPGLPDEAYEHDGALTKRHVRALTLAALAPRPGELLWDVGAGSGSVAIEWLRAEPRARALAVEARSDRAGRIAGNARRLGVPALRVVTGAAPAALEGLERPDAVFLGGGLSQPGMIEALWEALLPAGRILANAVTLEGEAALLAARARSGGELLRVELAHARPLGALTGWSPVRPIVQWSAVKP